MGLLVVENVRKVYGGRVVVKGVSLEVERGRITGLLGANGAGKTTTFYMVVGVVRPDGGTIYLDGTDVTRYPMHVRARMGIGYLAQEASIFRDLTVWDNVMAILEFMGMGWRERKNRAEQLLDELSLTHVKDSLGRALSGGERRRAEIARTLASEPKFILLDEPFAGVDPIAVGEIQRIVSYLKDKGLGILITDHNVRETLSICDHTYVMAEGRVFVEGTAEVIINNPEARAVYLGDDFEMPVTATAPKADTPVAKPAGKPVPQREALTQQLKQPEVPDRGPPQRAQPAPVAASVDLPPVGPLFDEETLDRAAAGGFEAPAPAPAPVPEAPPVSAAPPRKRIEGIDDGPRRPLADSPLPPVREIPPAPRSPRQAARAGVATVWPPPPGEPMLQSGYGEDGNDPPGGERLFPERERPARGNHGAAGRGIPWPAPPGHEGEGGE